MAHAHCRLDTSGYKHTLRISNIYCFSTATTFAQTCSSVNVRTWSIWERRSVISLQVYVCKLNWSRYRLGVAQRVGRGVALLFHDRYTRRGEWSAARLGHTLPPGKTRYPLYRRLGGTQGRSGRAENRVPTGIRSWTVQPVVSRYTDWATGPTGLCRCLRYKTLKLYGIFCLLNSEVCEGKHLGIFPRLAFKNFRFIAWRGLRETSVWKGCFLFSITISNVY